MKLQSGMLVLMTTVYVTRLAGGNVHVQPQVLAIIVNVVPVHRVVQAQE